MTRLVPTLLALTIACGADSEPTPPDWATSSGSDATGTSSGSSGSDATDSGSSGSSGSDTSSGGTPDWDLTNCDDVKACVAAHTELNSDGFVDLDDTIWECFPTVDPDQPTRPATCDCLFGAFTQPTFCGEGFGD